MIQGKRNLSLVDREEQEAKPWALGSEAKRWGWWSFKVEAGIKDKKKKSKDTPLTGRKVVMGILETGGVCIAVGMDSNLPFQAH